MTEPSAGYHGVRFFETFGGLRLHDEGRAWRSCGVFGPTLSPFNAWQLLQGIETLPVRMDRHCANAMAVAKYLRSHPKVTWVSYPGLPDSPYHDLAKRYMPKGAGSLLAFGVGSFEAGVKFIESLTFISHLANIGDAKSLVIHPASTTHRQLDEEQQRRAGVSGHGEALHRPREHRRHPLGPGTRSRLIGLSSRAPPSRLIGLSSPGAALSVGCIVIPGAASAAMARDPISTTKRVLRR